MLDFLSHNTKASRYLAILSTLALSLILLSPTHARKGKEAKIGKTIEVEYTGAVDNGIIFDTNLGQAPLKFTIGDNSVIKGFEDGIIGMRVGESRVINLPADYAYGAEYPNKIVKVALAQIQSDAALVEGANLNLKGPDGPIPVRIVEVNENDLYLDANHLLAGKDLTFAVKLLSVNSPK